MDVTHAALIRAWPLLRGWLEENREVLRIRQRLSESATEWKTHGQEESYLYRGARLAEVMAILKTHTEFLSMLEREFLAVSEQSQEKAAVAVQQAQIVARKYRILRTTIFMTFIFFIFFFTVLVIITRH